VIAAEQGAEDRRPKLGDRGGGLIDVALVVPADRTRVFQNVAGAQVQRTGGQFGQKASRCEAAHIVAEQRVEGGLGGGAPQPVGPQVQPQVLDRVRAAIRTR
jgi:hypothetical protein